MKYEITKDLETGNALIDSEHRQLLQAVNELMDACAQGKGRSQLEPMIAYLVSYVNQHFGDEEKLQMQSSYPGYAPHKQFHEAYKRELNQVAQEMKQDGASIAALGKLNRMISKLVTHIRVDDKKIAQHLKQS